ncbi:hepatitis A virus cellular receptor 1 isoform X3 [Pteropus medius]|uniref:hepatitis A virus cellular receptor 1 isoform X3 n=1 Tax=Pteropus vampyrus TaxID=132908 RepID=UPI00196A5602|nr:hepatitis A virus cellular receptor 1 isoform X3 [Pteropus giganteus]
MHPWLAFTSLILLWTDAVVSQVQVSGVVGQPVTLPCTYSTASEITTMCWGRGGCPRSLCSDQLIWTDGYRVTFQKDMRYELNGIIPKGNVSLTIKNAQQSDSGTYCCRIEHSGWFNDKKVNILLEIKPAPPKTTSVPTSPRVSTSAPTMPATTLKLTTENISSSPVQTTETQPTTPQKTYTTSLQSNSCLTDGNGTVAQPSDGGWQYNETLVCLEQTPQLTTNEAFYAGISITAMILLTILAAVISKKYLCTRKKVLQISKVSSNDLKNGALENATVVHYRADENIYFENNVYDTH